MCAVAVSLNGFTEWCLAYPISTLRWFRVRVWSHFKHFRISMPPKWMVIGYEMVWIGYPKTTNPFKLQEFLRRLRILSDDGVTFLSQTVTWSDFETPCCFSAASALETAKRENAFLDRSFRLMVMRYWYLWEYNESNMVNLQSKSGISSGKVLNPVGSIRNQGSIHNDWIVNPRSNKNTCRKETNHFSRMYQWLMKSFTSQGRDFGF